MAGLCKDGNEHPGPLKANQLYQLKFKKLLRKENYRKREKERDRESDNESEEREIHEYN